MEKKKISDCNPTIDSHMTDGRSYAVYSFTKQNFSKVEGVVLYLPCQIRNLPWKIIIQRSNENRNQKNLGFFLQCNGDPKSSSWSCYANARLTFFSQTEGVKNYTQEIQHTFSLKETCSGLQHFISWNNVINPDNGLIKNDTVRFQVQLFAEAPRGISSDCRKRKGDVLKNQQKVVDKNLPFQNLSSINLLKKIPKTESVFVENVTFLQLYLTDLKDAAEKRDMNRIKHLLGLIRAKISVMKSMSVEDITDWIKDVKQTLVLAEVEVKNAESILKLNEESSDDSPASTSSPTRIRTYWKPSLFPGTVDEYCRAWGVFDKAIDKKVRTEAPKRLKFDANDVLGDMPRTGENDQRAVAQLQNQYGDARSLSQTYYNQLERIAQANDFLAQRETVKKLRTIVHNLDALRETFPVNDDVITRNIIQKFPYQMLHSALQSLKSSKQDIMFHPTPAELLGALEDYLQIKEFITTYKM